MSDKDAGPAIMTFDVRFDYGGTSRVVGTMTIDARVIPGIFYGCDGSPIVQRMPNGDPRFIGLSLRPSDFANRQLLQAGWSVDGQKVQRKEVAGE